MRALGLTLLWIAASTTAFAQELTKPPRLVEFVEAKYPEALAALGTEGSVLLSIDIDENGRVVAVAIVESGGEAFDDAATVAAKAFVFEPGEVDGAAAPVRILYRYDFTLATEKVPLPPQINFEGEVLERYTKKPLAGITIALGAETSTRTDALGKFAFVGLTPETYRVTVSGPSLITVSTEETINAGKKTTVTYFVEVREEGVDEEVIVRAPRIKKQSAEIAIRTEEARRIPGTQGDTLKVVQNLPGVAHGQTGSGGLVVWGAAPKDTRVFVDGLEIPLLYHLGGVRSTISSDLVSSVELSPGAYAAEYGRGLGGLVSVTTKPLSKAAIDGFASINLLDAAAMISFPISEHLRVAVAGRYGWLDRVLRGTIDEKVAELFPIPRYADYQAKATLDLRSGEELSLLLLGSRDRLRRTLDTADPGEVRSDDFALDFWHGSLHYSRLFPDGASAMFAPGLGYERTIQRSTFGRVPTILEIETLRYAARGSYRQRLFESLTLDIGIDAQGTRSHVVRSGSLNRPPREGDLSVFGQPPGDDVNSDDYHAELAGIGPSVSLELSWGALELRPGVRFEIYAIDGSRRLPRVGATPEIGFFRLHSTIEPRLSAQFRASERVTLQSAIGLYHQPPAPEELSATFGTPELELERAIHATLGTRVRVTDTLELELLGFGKILDRLVTRSPSPSPPLAGALTQEGTGLGYGVEILLRQELVDGLFGWVSYSLSRAERRDVPDGPTRLFDFDQTHVLSVVASYEIEAWTFGTRFRFATGAPRTPIASSFIDLRGDQFQPIFGEVNTIRLANFAELDLRVERSFLLGFGKLSLYADLQNVLLRKNVEEIAYDFDYTQTAPITSLPFVAIVGARLEL